MIRRATPADLPAIDGFLSAHAVSSMFLRSNIAQHGIAGGAHPYATVVDVAPESGPLRAVFGRTGGGMLLLQAPDDAGETAAFAALQRARPVSGVAGEAAQAGRLVADLGLRTRTDKVEPLMMAGLVGLPDLPPALRLRPATPDDTVLLTEWFATYGRETATAPADPAAAAAEAAARAGAAPGGTVRLLVAGDTPVAMAALNAVAGTDVQVGGVFVPQALRNRGLGRAVVAALLAEARAGGATRADLFANNAAAARAYAALGFVQVGLYRIALAA